MPSRSTRTSLLVLAVASAALVRIPHAVADDGELVGPVLGAHRYVPTSLVVWSFINTEISSTSTSGAAQREPDESARVLGTPSRLFFTASQVLAGSIAIGPWFALSARAVNAGIVPHTIEAALAGGAHITAGGAVGVAIRFLHTDTFQLTASTEAGWQWTEYLVLLRYPDPRVIGDVKTVLPALSAAWTLAPFLGLQASASVALRRFDMGGRDDVASPTLALAASVGLGSVTMLFGGNVTHDFGRDLVLPAIDALLDGQLTQWRAQAGIFYTGKPELDVGATFLVDLDGSEDRRLLAELRLGFYF